MAGTTGRRRRGTQGRGWRRGVVSVLSMMFLILFGTLAAAMAILSIGNLRTATTHLHVMRAMGAAETGLLLAEQRIREAASRFVVERGEVDGDFGWRLWTGATSVADGQVDVLPPPSGHSESGDPAGIVQALANAHAADGNIVVVDGLEDPIIGRAPSGVDSGEYKLTTWLTTPAIGLNAAEGDATPAAFQITYAPLANGTEIRAIVTGFDFDHSRGDRPMTRVMMQDFRIVKRVDHAIVSPTRIMIGKNVSVEGNLGALYEDVDFMHGHPVVMRSDFEGLDETLDEKIEDFFANLVTYDADGDNRLRIDHPIEDGGIPSNSTDYDGDGEEDGAFADVTGDGYVDEFDIFINHFDEDGDGRVVLSADLTYGTPADGLTPEFVKDDGDAVDRDLAILIDSSNPDRNLNGLYGFIDVNGNGEWDPSYEDMVDHDSYYDVYPDQVLGYRDGVIDKRDRYAKLSGRIVFRTTADAWSDAQGDYTQFLDGPIRPKPGQSPAQFGASNADLPDTSGANFTDSETALRLAADGASFQAQVAEQLGIDVNALPYYDETGTDPSKPRYYRVAADGNGDGLPDNAASAYFEKMPFNSPSHTDWYYRPVFENMVFHDVQIPQGTNGLFRNCTFAGVTFVRSYADNTHPNWTLYGKMAFDPVRGFPVPAVEREAYMDTSYPPVLPDSALPPQQALFIADPPLDKGDVPAVDVAFISNYDDLPDPLVINGKRFIDTKQLGNNVRFHDCLFVGSIVSDTPSGYTHVRNKLQFTGATRFVERHPEAPDDPELNPEAVDLLEIAKSSMMLPNYSVDVGSFNSPPEQNVQLNGTVVAGVLDVRGNTRIDGALVLTFSPALGEGPLVDHLGNPVGNPAGFNATFGYFGPEWGDGESLDPESFPEINGERIVGWDTNGDGLPDVPPDQDQPDGSVAVPFHGYGRVWIRFDPNMVMPDGILMPLQIDSLRTTYSEGKHL